MKKGNTFAPQTADSLLAFCACFRGDNHTFRSPFLGPLDCIDFFVVQGRAGPGNEGWSVILVMNKHESPHLHEAGDCKISWGEL